ncbi:valyl-tRNA synthetase [Candidatus Kinetoplastibacterium oncopeltii TCC290E]|uniref:Valine--tRNA ligase n=1 Tax=Candidatus Kinetoplastidibacterium stringomonadis TCC290E TaxID=1208920 RepID=M1LS62_9PROT|nr:valine--tRNA ligase [Candidatus Kinetoplastibacterium oncopeltii]AGF48387.1 valyl-tRNA synthetase [Candidatus Kinetoplastibacterium oncopeltii TCC290E]
MNKLVLNEYTKKDTLSNYEDNLSKSFDPSYIEKKWNSEWEEKGYFKSGQQVKNDKNTEDFIIQFPPPNVTGTLHMGHAFNQTVMDCFVRYHRMSGDNTIFIPGTDHAGIATQMVVERQLDKKNISRASLGKEKFIEEIWKWKDHSGNTITNQVKRLGVSADWDKEYFTMDSKMSLGVVEAFVRLYKDGLIYRGKRLVNWDPHLLTAVSDLEVVTEEVNGYMWYISYPLSKEFTTESNEIKKIIVATTRPETIFADSAICVNPKDHRYNDLIGKTVNVPLINKEIPIIADDFVDINFGTGCVKITPAHDFNDYECALRHNLPIVEIFTKNAHLNDNVPEKYRGLDRTQARKIVIEDIIKSNSLVKEEEHLIMIPKGDRSGAILEPMITNQWFVSVSKDTNNQIFSNKSLAKIALEEVDTNRIKFYPENWKNTYRQWINNIQDWCISRQLWWGHSIPAWYSEDGQIFVARNEEEAYKEAYDLGITGTLTKDPDVLDTWFSSALVPFTTLGWPNDTLDLNKYLPSSILVTGFDIIFFWVTRMIMLTKYLTGKIPFRDVYIHGLVRDSDGKKMSKSKGNTLDPIDIIDGIDLENLIKKRTFGLFNNKQVSSIEKNTRKQFPKGITGLGTDSLRFTMASYATLGRDINFDIKRCEGYNNFCNKLWNASRFVLINAKDISMIDKSSVEFSFADKWIKSRLQNTILDIEKGFSEYRLDNISTSIYRFVWDEFCDWYLEMAKVNLQQFSDSQKNATKITLFNVLETILLLLHPIMPFITEELWQKMQTPSLNKTSISIQSYPKINIKEVDQKIESRFLDLKSQIESIRALRGSMNIPPSHKVPLIIKGDKKELSINTPYLIYFSKLEKMEIVDYIPKINAPLKIVGSTHIMLNVRIDPKEELSRLNTELFKISQEIDKSKIKLGNIGFVKNAPIKVVEKEKNKLEILEKTLISLNKQCIEIKNIKYD